MKFLVLLCLIALLISVAAAHHSVRVKKPATEEERIEHHLLHRRQPKRRELKNDYSIPADENAWKGTKSQQYHFKVGPEYPHGGRRQDYKKGGRHNIPMSAREVEDLKRGQ